jgi:NAD(P)-dependent dehydrogenase (short-subunit alcohol dehydrogenase family)
MIISLESKRVVVTGGSSGLGEAMSIAAAAAGAKVAVNYSRHADKAKAVVAKIQAAGGEAFAIKADVSKPKAAAMLFAAVEKRWGGIDVLINNAGIDGKRALAWKADFEDWNKVMEINLTGAFLCAAEALKRMVPKKRGVILNVTSVHEIIPWSGFSAYAASKAGVAMMTKTLAQEAAPYGIRVLAIAPGAIRTPINRAVWSNPKALKDLEKKIPLQRMGEPREIAAMAVVLVSDAASYVTGCSVTVDGGMTDYADFAHGG